jgi:predicted nucleotidyltransferase
MLSKDFKEFAELLNSNGVEYLVVGGFALAAHGRPRYTGDLDFWVGTDPVNAEHLLRALDQFGFSSLGVSAADLTTANNVIQLGFPPRRIDLLTSIDGAEFAPSFQRRMDVVMDGLTLHFISLDDFKANKRAAGRLQDRADLRSLGEDVPD